MSDDPPSDIEIIADLLIDMRSRLRTTFPELLTQSHDVRVAFERLGEHYRANKKPWLPMSIVRVIDPERVASATGRR